MALPFPVSREDMLRSKVLDPGWYKVRIKKAYQEPSNAGDSTNTWIEFIIIDGPKQKDNSDPKDTPCRRCFSEKAPGFIVPFLRSVGFQVTENGGVFDIEKVVGREILIYVDNRMYENKLQNDVADFKALAA